MAKILVIEDESFIKKFLNEIPSDKIFTIYSSEINILQYGDITLNTYSYEVFKNEEKIELTAKEFQILKLLIENPNKVFTREELLERIWKYEFSKEEQVIYSHIKNIRRKLGDDLIKTIRGVGYKI